MRHKDLFHSIPRHQLEDLTKQGKLDVEAQSTFVTNVSPTSKDIKAQIVINNSTARAQELRESGDGRSGLPVPNSPYGLCGRKTTLNERKGRIELRSWVKAEVVVLGSPTLTLSLYVFFFSFFFFFLLFFFYGRKATTNSNTQQHGLFVPNMSARHMRTLTSKAAKTAWSEIRSCVKVEVGVLGSPSLIVPMVSMAQSNIELEHTAARIVCS